MSRKRSRGARPIFVALSLIVWSCLPAVAQQGDLGASLPRLVESDVSPPLRDIPPVPPREERRVIPLRPVPPVPHQAQPDTVVQQSAGAAVSTTNVLNFDGIGQGVYGFTVTAAPPDTNGAVGATQYVQWVNFSFAVFDKATGNRLFGPVAGNTLWQGFKVAACANNNDGDPIAQYDKAANRWVMAQLSFTGGPPYYECIAVSQTSDATGAYNRYALQWVNNTFPDYPKLGVWPDAYYFSFNMFLGGLFFQGAQVCGLDRNLMLNGFPPGPDSAQCFQLSASFASLLPADLDGSNAPPVGSPNFFLNFGANSLNLWKFQVDFTNPNNTTLTGPINIPVAPFTAACNGGGTCIPQSGTSQKLDSLGDRLMYRLAYRNFTNHESLVVNHSVATGGRKGPTGVRWYEIRNPNGTPTVFQQGTYAPDSNFRWMGSIAMDKAGDIALGYSVSSSTMFPSIRFTGRVPADPPGTMEAENSIKSGAGSQLPNLSRWGDYSSISIDPVDDCTFFYTSEYLKSSGTFNWSTQIASFKFPGC